MQSPIAWDADEPKFDGGPETHAFRDEAFAEAMRKPSNLPPLSHPLSSHTLYLAA